MKIQIYQDTLGAWRWRAVAGNGQIMADSAESYDTRANVERAIDRLIDLIRSPLTFWQVGSDGVPVPFWTSKN